MKYRQGKFVKLRPENVDNRTRGNTAGKLGRRHPEGPVYISIFVRSQVLQSHRSEEEGRGGGFEI